MGGDSLLSFLIITDPTSASEKTTGNAPYDNRLFWRLSAIDKYNPIAYAVKANCRLPHQKRLAGSDLITGKTFYYDSTKSIRKLGRKPRPLGKSVEEIPTRYRRQSAIEKKPDWPPITVILNSLVAASGPRT